MTDQHYNLAQCLMGGEAPILKRDNLMEVVEEALNLGISVNIRALRIDVDGESVMAGYPVFQVDHENILRMMREKGSRDLDR